MMPGVTYVMYGSERNTGRKYYCTYYSRKGDRLLFEEAN